jgi:hypothetical protein
MDSLSQMSVVKHFGIENIENKILESYRDGDSETTTLIENFFANCNASHLLRPNLGRNGGPLLRVFSAVDTKQALLLSQEINEYELHFSKTYTEKSGFYFSLKELAFSYITDFCRRYTCDYTCITSDFRPKILRNFECHMCCAWKKNSYDCERVMRQLLFLKTFQLAREETQMRNGISRLTNEGVGEKLNEEVVCSNPAECTVEADALIVDHTEQYVTLAQVMTLMEQHNSTRALGYLLFPDGIDFKEKGSFYDGNLYFDRSKDSYLGVENPVLFYDKNNWFTNAIYPWEEYKKFFEKTLIIKNGKAYRYEIVKRTHGVLFYSITEDGDYTKDYPAPSYQLLRFEEYYEVRSFRPRDLVFGKNFDNFKWVTCFIPRVIFAKTLAFALGVGQGDFNRKTISERLCDTYMRTVNPATSAVTTFDRQLMPYEIEVATDAIWTQAYLERRRNSDILARQKYINDYYGNVGLNFNSVKKIVKQTLSQLNPINLLSDYFAGVAEDLYLDKWTEFLPHSILHGTSRLIQGEMTIMNYDEELKTLQGGINFYPKWYVALKAIIKKKPENKKKLMDSILRKVTTKFGEDQTKSRFRSLLNDVTQEEEDVDEIRFFTDEVVAIHDEPGFTEGDREVLLNRLNIATDAHEPLLRNVVVSQEVQIGEPGHKKYECPKMTNSPATGTNAIPIGSGATILNSSKTNNSGKDNERCFL